MDPETQTHHWIAEIFGQRHEPPCAQAPDITDDEPYRWPWSWDRQEHDQ